jgi:predicted CXXCH cytochrome family protein
VTDEDAFLAALAPEMDRIGGAILHGRGDDLIELAISSTRSAFGGKDLIEVGIGCESCHNGSKAHARDPKVKTSLVPRGSFFAIDGAISQTAAINRVCARCHQVLFSKYPYTWEGGTRDKNPGGSHINSGEARDFLLGGCTSALACTACHDPHGDDNHARALRLESKDGDAVCTRCHAGLASDDALRTHAHHEPSGVGARCMGCHMPKKNMSLDGGLTRYHRIASPTEEAKVLRDRPLECALCHPRESVESLVSTMERWWGKKYERTSLDALYGDRRAPVMKATLERGKPHEKAVALTVLGETRDETLAPLFARELTNEYPLLRGYAERALENTLGSRSPIDLVGGTDEEIQKAAAAWLARRP